jgi:Schlafen, AlbA_2
MNEAIVKYLRSEDPLSDDAIELLLKYKEEDLYTDYKEMIEKKYNKEWIELTKDIMSFANSHGGYLLFGIQDSTYNLIGLDEKSAAIIKNTDMVQQKINRYTEPEILNLRSKEYINEGKIFVVLFIPESLGKTHMVSKDAVVKYPSGDKKIILHKGTIYVRRSAGNHLCDSRDIDELISQRIKHFKKNLLSNISRVVEAPAESDVYILSQDPTAKTNKKFIIEDAPDAIKIKGMSFTISPETIEQEVSAWISLSKKDAAALPPPKILWKWYFQRESLDLSKAQRLAVAKFCIVSDVPAFFWIKGCTADSI